MDYIRYHISSLASSTRLLCCRGFSVVFSRHQPARSIPHVISSQLEKGHPKAGTLVGDCSLKLPRLQMKTPAMKKCSGPSSAKQSRMEKFFATKPTLKSVEGRDAGAQPSGRTSEGGSGGAVLREVNGSPRKREHEVTHVHSRGKRISTGHTPLASAVQCPLPCCWRLSIGYVVFCLPLTTQFAGAWHNTSWGRLL